MTATFQTSFFAPLENEIANRKARRSSRKALRFFQVDIENFDNEVESYEIEAHSASEAAEIAESQFGGDIYNMNIYEQQNF
jgi:hypothetical protein